MTSKKIGQPKRQSAKPNALARRSESPQPAPVKPARIKLPTGYAQLLEDLKARIRQAQVRAAVAANRELLALYWQIGKAIVQRQRVEGWGKAVIDRLAADIQSAFPGIKGFSPSNIWRMRAFYLTWKEQGKISAQRVPKSEHDFLPSPAPKSKKKFLAPAVRESLDSNLAQPARELEERNLPPLVAEITWAHNVILMERVKDLEERLWYAQQTLANGWSRNILALQIETGLYHRQGKAVTNFERTLPPAQSDLAQQTIKDPYVFDFLTLTKEATERDLERGLIEHIRKFLLELGVGFAYLGSQVPLTVGEDDFYLDLLFYHVRLRCYVIIELKEGEFKPEYAGKMNFYLSAVDDRMRHPDDQPSLGLILCRTKNRIIAEYALRDVRKPIGVADWKLVETLPKNLRGSLPSIEELEAELGSAAGVPRRKGHE